MNERIFNLLNFEDERSKPTFSILVDFTYFWKMRGNMYSLFRDIPWTAICQLSMNVFCPENHVVSLTFLEAQYNSRDPA